jgi:hypothetical protein
MRISHVAPTQDYCLDLTFSNGEHRRFDVRPYLDKGVFRQLRNYERFRQVRVVSGTVEWPGQLDLCPDTLYEKSHPFPDNNKS